MTTKAIDASAEPITTEPAAIEPATIESATIEPATVQVLLEIDRVIHEPARLAILSILSGAEEVEFKFLETLTGLSKGNLSSHTSKLEASGLIEVVKTFRGRTPVTSFRLTDQGRQALAQYWAALRAVVPAV
jgi:DNA-binding transcriptional ArsR family regulator